MLRKKKEASRGQATPRESGFTILVFAEITIVCRMSGQLCGEWTRPAPHQLIRHPG